MLGSGLGSGARNVDSVQALRGCVSHDGSMPGFGACRFRRTTWVGAFFALWSCTRQPEPSASPPARATSTEPAIAQLEACCDAEPRSDEAPPPTALEAPPLSLPPPSASTSVGTPVEGHLVGGTPLPLVAPGLMFNPAKNPEARHGTVELVGALLRAGANVDQRFPGSVVTIGDLSMPQGGDIPGHASHRSGRDVDVLFFLLDAKDSPIAAKAIPLEPDGTGVDYQDLSTADDDVPVKLDVPRTWAFVEALVLDDGVSINRIFVVEHIRRILLDHAESIDAPLAARERFSDLTCQPGFPHDDHMHIRIFCSAEDIALGCEDTPPVYPWHRRELAKAGTQPVMAGERRVARPALTSNEGAETKARETYGEFAPEVTAFLARRKAWVRKPHPGRRYCR